MHGSVYIYVYFVNGSKHAIKKNNSLAVDLHEIQLRSRANKFVKAFSKFIDIK